MFCLCTALGGYGGWGCIGWGVIVGIARIVSRNFVCDKMASWSASNRNFESLFYAKFPPGYNSTCTFFLDLIYFYLSAPTP